MQFSLISAVIFAQLAFAQDGDSDAKAPANATANATAGALNSTANATASGNKTDKAPAAKNATDAKASVNATGAKAAGAKPSASPMEAGAQSPVFFSTTAFFATLAVAAASL